MKLFGQTGRKLEKEEEKEWTKTATTKKKKTCARMRGKNERKMREIWKARSLSIATFKQIPKDKIYTLLLASRSSLFFVSFQMFSSKCFN